MGLSNTDFVMAILSAKQNHCFSPVEEMEIKEMERSVILWPSSLTRMSSKSSGERINAVNVLDTTVGGLFSGSLKRCCKHTNPARKKAFQQNSFSAPHRSSFSPAAVPRHSSSWRACLFKVTPIPVSAHLVSCSVNFYLYSQKHWLVCHQQSWLEWCKRNLQKQRAFCGAYLVRFSCLSLLIDTSCSFTGRTLLIYSYCRGLQLIPSH